MMITYLLLLLGAGVPRDSYLPEFKERHSDPKTKQVKERARKADSAQVKAEELAPNFGILYDKKMNPRKHGGC